jgi:hypothetical protein
MDEHSGRSSGHVKQFSIPKAGCMGRCYKHALDRKHQVRDCCAKDGYSEASYSDYLYG